MLTAIIPLPQNFVSDILANMGQILSDVAPYITLILGVLLASLVLGIIIDHFKK